MPGPAADRPPASTGAHVALLRGINVGGGNKVAMAQLKELFEALGYRGVATYINSGNVLFDAKAPVAAAEVEAAFEDRFGFRAPILVRGRGAILGVAGRIPAAWRNDAEQRTEVLFLWDEHDDPAAPELLPARAGIDSVMYVPGALVWNFRREDATRSGIAKLVGSKLYRHLTARNVNTVRKLAELLAARE